MADGLPHDERTFLAGHQAAAGNATALNRTAGGNATAAFEEPDPEEIQHAVLAFYLVVRWAQGCFRREQGITTAAQRSTPFHRRLLADRAARLPTAPSLITSCL